MFHIIDSEQFLEGHTADSCNGVKTGKCQRRYTHRHEALCSVYRDAEHFQKSGNTGRKDRKWRSDSSRTVCRSSSTGNAEGEDGKQALQNHSSVSDFLHIFFIRNGFRRGSRRYQAVESGNSTTGNGDKQDREQISGCRIVETGVHWKIHFRVCNNKSDNSAKDHAGKHKGCHKVTRLHQKPHRKDSGKKDVGKYQISPGCFACYKRYIHADCKSCNGACKAEYHFFPAFPLQFFLEQSEDNSKSDKQKGDASGSAVYSCLGRKLCDAVNRFVSIKCSGNHIGKGGDNDQCKEPAEEKKQFFSCFADVFLNEKSHGFSFVFDTRIQRTEIGNSTKEDTADQDP